MTTGPAELAGITADGTVIGRLLYDDATTLARSLGYPSREHATLVARVMLATGHVGGAAPEPPRPQSAERDVLRGAFAAKRNSAARHFGQTLVEVTGHDQNETHHQVNRRLVRLFGVKVRGATIDQLQAQMLLIDAWRTGIAEARRDGVADRWVMAWGQGAYDVAPSGSAGGVR